MNGMKQVLNRIRAFFKEEAQEQEHSGTVKSDTTASRDSITLASRDSITLASNTSTGIAGKNNVTMKDIRRQYRWAPFPQIGGR